MLSQPFYSGGGGLCSRENYVYVATGGGNLITVSTSSDAITEPPLSLNIINPSLKGMAIMPNNANIYVSSSVVSDAVAAASISPQSLITTIAVADPYALAITPDSSTVYVVSDQSLSAALSIISTASNSKIKEIALSGGSFDLAITPNGSKVYVPHASSTVSVISTTTNDIIQNIPVGDSPACIAITPDGTKAYVANQGDDTVSVISIATDSVIGSPIPVGDTPGSIAITPDGSKAYVGNFSGNSVSVISTIDNSVSTISSIPNPIIACITPDGSTCYVRSGNNAIAISTKTNAVIATIPLTSANAGPSVATFDSQKLYMISSNYLNIISIPNNTLLGAISIPSATTLTITPYPSNPTISPVSRLIQAYKTYSSFKSQKGVL